MDNYSQEAVELFWELCGRDSRFPRNIERVVALALPITIIKIPQLNLRAAENWLRQRGVPFHFGCKSRAVRGCLVAFAGRGLIFIDADDPEDEQRFTAAHEAAHFLADYWLPRQKALKKFGPNITNVMDGLRKPTTAERINAVIIGTQIGVYTDLMGRENDEPHNNEVWDIEERADSIALELLAPQDEVFSCFNLPTGGQFAQRVEKLGEELREKFGLPVSVSQSYSTALLKNAGRGRSWMESLGFQ
jgi:hypothetical protein